MASRWTSTGVPVNVIAGCRARKRAAAGGVEHLGAVTARGVHEELPGAHGAGLGEAGHQRRQGVVGDREQDELGTPQDLLGGDEGDAGQERLGPAPGGVGDAGGGHRAVPGELQGGGEGRADAAGADDADGESGGAVPGSGCWTVLTRGWPSRSSPRGVPDDFSSC